MSWRDHLIDGKWRGITFFYERVEGEIGRRNVLKEFPGVDQKPIVEDLGLATRRFTLDMFVIGDDYMTQRDSLRRAFEQAGAGQLDHPYWGKMQVTVVGQVRFTESTRNGGMATFTATFVQNGDPLRNVVDAAALGPAMLTTAEKMVSAINGTFAAAFGAVKGIQRVVNNAIGDVQSVMGALNGVRGKIAATLQTADDVASAVSEVATNASALVREPLTLATSIEASFVEVMASVTSTSASFVEALAFYGTEDSLPAEGNVIAARTRVGAVATAIVGFANMPALLPQILNPLTTEDAVQNATRGQLSRLTQVAAIYSVVSVMDDLEFESYDQAEAMRDSVVGLVDTLTADDDLEDEVYGPLMNTRAALVDFFANVAGSLPELESFTPLQTVPALVIAYQVYGDATRESDILARNPGIEDPSAVPGGVAIQVLIS